MTRAIVIFSLVLSGANWLVFVTTVVVSNLAAIRQALSGTRSRSAAEDDELAHTRSGAGEVIEATGTLAVSFKSAGPASAAAAMSLAYLLIAVAAAGIEKL